MEVKNVNTVLQTFRKCNYGKWLIVKRCIYMNLFISLGTFLLKTITNNACMIVGAITAWLLSLLWFRTLLSLKHTNEPPADRFLYHNEPLLLLVWMSSCSADNNMQAQKYGTSLMMFTFYVMLCRPSHWCVCFYGYVRFSTVPLMEL